MGLAAVHFPISGLGRLYFGASKPAAWERLRVIKGVFTSTIRRSFREVLSCPSL